MTHTPGWQAIDGAATMFERIADGAFYPSNELLAWASALRAVELNPVQAAAPALLEALERLTDLFEKHPAATQPLTKSAIAAARDAIAQSRGANNVGQI